MQALFFDKTLSYRNDFPAPELLGDEALIKIQLAGICGTDLELTKGYANFSGIPGHEFVGRVACVQHPRHRHWLGQRVVASINIGCGHCTTCLNNGPEHCPSRKVVGIRSKQGAFADYLSLPVKNLYAVPVEVSERTAVFSEPLAAALAVLNPLRSVRAKTVAVLGPGRLGILIAKILSLTGYDPIVLGRSESSLDLPKRWKLRSTLGQSCCDDSFECVVDATGQSAGFLLALKLLRPGGTLILKSTFQASEPIDFSPAVVKELQIFGSRCGSIPEALSVLQQKVIDVEALIDGVYPFKNGPAAFEHANRPGTRKILLFP